MSSNTFRDLEAIKLTSDENNTTRKTVSCQDIEGQADDLVASQLSDHETELFQNHINSCPQCTAFIASYKHVIEVAAELGAQPVKPLGVDVQNRLRAALNQRLGISLSYIA